MPSSVGRVVVGDRGRPFGEVVGTPVVGRFFVFLGSEKFFFLGGGVG